ncbi:PREDICTED: probable U3 small nucleolar RNA-associated protein 7 [Camelina sativa]|uniref:Probable U3 small nucleolar RNA-associated protein 7 n=1 Tax=Camelina sativa TaxID=90675 RepID=A0ABM1R2X3_CAMSA|nr:PREDICTED: probable U3 small nucleolar RNA-associated protein 7 [Camelina sativa]
MELSSEKVNGKSAKTAAKIEKLLCCDVVVFFVLWLLPAEAGYLETDGLEKTWRVKQTDIANEVDLLSSRNQYDIVLPDFGPYKLDFTASGRHMIAGGRKGHLALVDMMSMNLIKEIQVKETVCDVAFLHNEQFFAAAQKKYVLSMLINITYLGEDLTKRNDKTTNLASKKVATKN